VAEGMGKDKAIRRLYCKTCGTRFSEKVVLTELQIKLQEVLNTMGPKTFIQSPHMILLGNFCMAAF